MELTEQIARKLAATALGHVAREYPHKLDHVMTGDADVLPPRTLHPCFFGSFDWHSCVHGWWTLLTLRRLYPDMSEAAQIDALAQATFTEGKLAAELAYLDRPEARGFERPYGWGWFLYLHLEATRHEDRDWGKRLEPLARAFSARMRDYLDILTYPVTVGTHFNTAFALALSREWAKMFDPALLASVDQWAMRAFAGRSDYRGWEPGGDEFLSPVLTAALLMGEIIPRGEFAVWFSELVLANGWLESECRPATVSDRTDGKIAHLDGLNLSRAWCLYECAAKVGPHGKAPAMLTIADSHLEQAIGHVTGDYMGEHWLASFALLALLSADGARAAI